MDPSALLTFQVLHGIALVATVGIGVAIWFRREMTGAKPLLALMVGTTAWIGGTLGAQLAPTHAATTDWLVVLWIGAVTVPPAIFVFALQYTGREHLVSRRTVIGLTVVPAATFLLVLTNDVHGAIWADVGRSDATPTGLDLAHGPAFWVFAIYAQTLVAGATVLILGLLYRSTTIYRGQAASLILAIGAPWIGSLTYLADVTPVDWTPLAFAVTAVALGFAMVRYRFGDIVPVARNTVVDNITDGVVVLDRRDRVVDVNRRALSMLAIDGTAVGRHATEVFQAPIATRHVDEADAGGHDGPRTDEVRVDTGRGARYLAVDVTPLQDRRERSIGRLFVLRDVTDHRRYERELERQNDRLDRFASLVSHDLRNPLAVAQGYLENVRERTGDDPDVAEVRRSLDRMDRIIADVLTLAREGASVSEADRERVAVGAVAAEAWDQVATGDATLSIAVDHEVRADPARLSQAFENLFRNAVEHGSTTPSSKAPKDAGRRPSSEPSVADAPEDAEEHGGNDVQVEVSGLERDGGRRVCAAAGFAVTDDGPGIPDAHLDSVFEAGFTTASDGTGLGLDIVKTIVEAHGWQLSVTNGDASGARFEIRYEPIADVERESAAITD